MNIEYVRTLWEEFRLVNGITTRVIEAIPADKIGTRPVRDMRTPTELVVHMAETMRGVVEGIVSGEIKEYESSEKALCPTIQSRDDLAKLMRDAWAKANKAIGGLRPEQATAMVKSPWGMDFPGWVCVQIVFDEHLHHRGQLYAFLRALGVEPPFMWDFENNAAEFKPRQHQQA
ncbi:MAG TPA: DinB family protein [Candidatus Eisenbacteria bacterium]